MSNNPKKKKKLKLKVKKEKKISNEDIKENNINIIPPLEYPNMKSTLQLLSSINNDLDALSGNMKSNNIFKNPFSFNINEYKTHNPLLANNNYFYDKQDLETKELLNKANIYLNNNNIPKQIISNYENKIIQTRGNYANNYNSYNNYIRNNKYNSRNPFFENNNNNNFYLNNTNNMRKENIKSRFINIFQKNRKNNSVNKFINYSNYNTNNIKRDNTNHNLRIQLKKNNFRNNFDNNINKRTKKLEDISSYLNNYLRRPIVYSQPDSTKFKGNIMSKSRIYSSDRKYPKFKENYNQYIRENDNKTIDILKNIN